MFILSICLTHSANNSKIIFIKSSLDKTAQNVIYDIINEIAVLLVLVL